MDTALKEDKELWEQAACCGVCGSGEYENLFSVNRKSYVRCKSCRVTRLYDRVAVNKLAVLYNDYYESNGGQLSEQERKAQLANPTFAFRRKRLEEFIPSERRHFYEIGCGDGNFLAYLADAGWRVTGCEFGEQTIQLIKNRHGIEVDHGDFINGDVEPCSVDNIGAYHVLEHVYEPRLWLRQVRHALKPEGLFHLQIPNFSCFERHIAGDCWASLCFPQHVYFYSPDNLQSLLLSEGFRTLSIVTYDPWHSPGSMLISAKNIVRRLITGRTPWQEFSITSAGGAESPAAVNGLGQSRPMMRMMNALGHPAAVIAARSQSLFGFGNVIDIIAQASD